MGDTVHATFEVTEADIVSAFAAIARRHPLIRWARVGQLVALAMTVLWLAAMWPLAPGLWIALVPLQLAALFGLRLESSALARRYLAATSSGPVDVTFSDEEILEVSRLVERGYPWSTVAGWVETDRVIAAFGHQDDVLGCWPKRCFDDDRLGAVRARFDARFPQPTPTRKADTHPSGTKTLLFWLAIIVLVVVVSYYLTARS
ncbi:MAG: YcxB family protein [Sandaracinaceae bacterium]